MLRDKSLTNCTNFTTGSYFILEGRATYRSIFDADVWLRFWSWSLVDILKLSLVKILKFQWTNCHPWTIFVYFDVFGTFKSFTFVSKKILSSQHSPKSQNISRKQEQMSLNKGNMKKRKFGWMVIGRSHSIPNNQNFFLVHHWLQIEIIFWETIEMHDRSNFKR